jgi:hypothetical protein
VFDGYRPWRVTKLFWDVTPPEKREFVADPAKGSKHNRGCAIDLSLYDLATGREVEMPSAYDEMSERAYPDYTGGTAAARERRDLLRAAMEKEGFDTRHPIQRDQSTTAAERSNSAERSNRRKGEREKLCFLEKSAMTPVSPPPV